MRKWAFAVKESKCEVIPLAGQSDDDLLRAGLPVSKGQVKVVRNGFDFLGAPIGDAEFCEAHMRRKMEGFAR